MTGKDQSPSDWYADIITERKTQLLGLSSYLVADAWFAKCMFVDQVMDTDMHLISRLRDDANLRYCIKASQQANQEDQKKYDGKVDNNNIDLKHFEPVSEDKQAVIHSAIILWHYCRLKV
ncbi:MULTISPECIES: hypothetical protein [unclassified Carboxylicivirga]|uniref:hypothetical protein n=1 Tax=Carboxylicivirga TaxID=1628153 RepID=UPI003D331BB3